MTDDRSNLVAWSAHHPDLVYMIESKGERSKQYPQWNINEINLVTARFSQQGNQVTTLARTKLNNFQLFKNAHDNPSVKIIDGELWVTGHIIKPKGLTNITKSKSFRGTGICLIRFGLDDPTKPMRIASYELPGFFGMVANVSGHNTTMDRQKWPRDDGLDRETYDKVYAHVSQQITPHFWQNNRVIAYIKSGIKVYEPTNKRPFRLVDELLPSPLEKLIDAKTIDWLLHEGLLYVLINEPQSGVVVYDVRPDHPLRKLGYYYAPNEILRKITVMDDGRVALVGKNIHVLAALDRKLAQH